MPVLLIVLDGWGLRKTKKGNAILAAKTPNFNKLWKKYPHTTLEASGTAVGLPKGYMGNSEVGHLHLGAGRLVEQDLKRINKAIKNKSFFKNKVLKDTFKETKTLHLMGLLSDGGVHSHIKHLFALLEAAKGVKEIYIHCFLDGRDTPPKSAKKYIKQLQNKLPKNAKIATLVGRYYAMDRDNRWTRQREAYDALVLKKGKEYNTPLEALEAAYNENQKDEFVTPRIIKGTKRVKSNDTLIFFNFRSDRARQITRSFTSKKFKMFKRKKLNNLKFVSLTQYDPKTKSKVIMNPLIVDNPLGQVLAVEKFAQLRIAETEKYAHVTYFFNGLSGRVFRNEDRILISSPKVKTYDLKPSMSAYKITSKLIKSMKEKKYNFILVNFANTDMVGHTGNFASTVEATQVVDKCLGKIISKAKDYDVLITADHGNAELMFKDGQPFTAHTTNPVPFIAVTKKKLRLKKGSLYHVAPTVLEFLGVEPPSQFSKSLIRH